MTEALTDATTAELRENNLVAVPRDAWTAMQDRMDNLESELENQSQNVGGAFAKIGKVEDRVDDLEARNQQTEAHSDGTTPRGEGGKEPPETWTPLETVVSLPEDVAARELRPTQKRARFLAKDLDDYGTRVPAGIRIDSRDARRVLSAAAENNQTIHRTQVRRVFGLLDDLGRDDVRIRTERGRTFMIITDKLVDRLAEQERNGVRNADQAVRALQAT